MHLCYLLPCTVCLTWQPWPNSESVLASDLESGKSASKGGHGAIYLKWSLTWTLGTPENLPALIFKIFNYSTLILALKKILLRALQATWNIYYCLGIRCGFHWSWPQTLEYVLIYLGREYRTPHAECHELSAEAEGQSWEWLMLKKKKNPGNISVNNNWVLGRYEKVFCSLLSRIWRSLDWLFVSK